MTQLERARTERGVAEREKAELSSELARTLKVLELYKRQASYLPPDEESLRSAERAAAEAERAAAEGREAAARAHAEREELRASLGAALDQLATEKAQAEERAAMAEAKLRARGGGHLRAAMSPP